MATTLAILSLILSVVSTMIAIASFRRAKIFQEYDYAVWLQLGEEKIVGGGRDADDAFTYSAQLENSGLKPVHIESINLDYGGDSHDRCFTRTIGGEFYLPANGNRKFECVVSKRDYAKALAQFQLEQCQFRLRIRYFNATNQILETVRNIIARGSVGYTLYMQKGNVIG